MDTSRSSTVYPRLQRIAVLARNAPEMVFTTLAYHIVVALIERTPGLTATLATNKGSDTKSFVQDCIHRGVTPHIARKEYGRRRSAVPAEIAASEEYTASMEGARRHEVTLRVPQSSATC